LYGLLFGLTPEDVQGYSSEDGDGLSRGEWKPVTDFDTAPKDYSRVRVPGALYIKTTNPASMALVESWKKLQPHLQSIVDIQDNHEFLKKMMLPFVREQG